MTSYMLPLTLSLLSLALAMRPKLVAHHCHSPPCQTLTLAASLARQTQVRTIKLSSWARRWSTRLSTTCGSYSKEESTTAARVQGELSNRWHRHQVDEPTVKLLVTTKQDPQLYVMLTIKSGSIEIYISKDPRDNTKKNFDATAWTESFTTNL